MGEVEEEGRITMYAGKRYFVAWHPRLNVFMDADGYHTTSLSRADTWHYKRAFAYPWLNIGVVLRPKSVSGQDIRPHVAM